MSALRSTVEILHNAKVHHDTGKPALEALALYSSSLVCLRVLVPEFVISDYCHVPSTQHLHPV